MSERMVEEMDEGEVASTGVTLLIDTRNDHVTMPSQPTLALFHLALSGGLINADVRQTILRHEG